MDNTFFWHDYETFGTIPKSDRPAQFAGIRTDMNLNEIGQPVMLYCKPSLDTIIPSLEACLITGITPQYCEEHGVPEYEFASIIERHLASPGTIGVGYNNIKFDDEVTRFLFWRNLISPYSREFQNNCSRWDLLNVARAVYAFSPEALNWPRNQEGKISFKLQDLSAANGLAHENAHDALSDVRATIDLARLIKKSNERLFEYCLNLRKKDFVTKQLSLISKTPIVHVSSMYSMDNACTAVIWPLAQHPTNSNEIIVWDLSNDPTILINLNVEEIKNRLFYKSTATQGANERLPIKTISINKSPFIAALNVLTLERAQRLNINLALIEKNSNIAKHLQLPPQLWQEVYHKAFDKQDVDEDLYSGFLPYSDSALLAKLCRMSSNQLHLQSPKFEDERLAELFFRYRARNFPEILCAEEQEHWRLFCKKKYQLNIGKFLDDFHRLQVNATEREKLILSKLQAWVEQHA